MRELKLPAAIVIAAALLSAGIVAGPLIKGGGDCASRFTVHASGSYVYRLDRQTGEMVSCIAGVCERASQR